LQACIERRYCDKTFLPNILRMSINMDAGKDGLFQRFDTFTPVTIEYFAKGIIEQLLFTAER